VEDLASVALVFASGMVAQLTSVWHDILSRGSTRWIEVFCREGMVSLNNEFLGPLRVQTSEVTEDRPCPSPEWVDALPLAKDRTGLAIRAYVEADHGFIEAVTDGRAPSPGSTWPSRPTAWSTRPTARLRPGECPSTWTRRCRRPRSTAPEATPKRKDDFAARPAHPEVGKRR
jgi:hypothetical protein